MDVEFLLTVVFFQHVEYVILLLSDSCGVWYISALYLIDDS